MRDRPTIRVLLFDHEGRLLLIKLVATGDRPDRWHLAGGGIDPGESLEAAARREVREETGLDCVAVGPLVWLRDGQGRLFSGEPVRFLEHFIVARCAAGDLTDAGWEAHEHLMMGEMRWFTLEEIAALQETVYPEGLAHLLADVAQGRFPEEPIRLTPWAED